MESEPARMHQLLAQGKSVSEAAKLVGVDPTGRAGDRTSRRSTASRRKWMEGDWFRGNLGGQEGDLHPPRKEIDQEADERPCVIEPVG